MATSELTLYGQATWMCPWGFHASVALIEKQLTYRMELVTIPMSPERKAAFEARALLAGVPLLVHGERWITESLAISEYLAETFPFPAHPRIFPADLGERARARQVMSWLRTSLRAMRAERSVDNVFGQTQVAPLTPKAQAEADELLRVAGALVAPGRTQMFTDWSIADADLAVALMRLIASDDPVPPHLVAYAHAQWDRPSARTYLANLPPRKIAR